jgi:hypothetical protein
MESAVSGAKDTASFEVRLNDGSLPPLSSITHEGTHAREPHWLMLDGLG